MILGSFISTYAILYTARTTGAQDVFQEDDEDDFGFNTWPAGLARCSLDDENLDDCIKQAAKQVLPFLVKGHKELGLVSLDPIAMGNFTLTARRGPVSLNMELANAYLTGQSKLQLTSVRYDRERYRLELEGLHREVELTGDYTATGHVFRVPINSAGTLLFTLKNMEAMHVVQFKPREERGLTYMDLQVFFKINHADSLKMDLYNPKATKFAGLALNKLLNDNWRQMLAAFTPPMEEEVERTFTEAFRPMFRRIPFEEILPEESDEDPDPEVEEDRKLTKDQKASIPSSQRETIKSS